MSKQADLILKNAIVLTMDEDFNQYEPGAVVVKDDSILAAGPEADIVANYSAKESIDCEGKVLMPGLVNAHTHIPMTMLRGIADDLRLDVWLLGYMMPVEREFVSSEFVQTGTSIGCAEFIRTGITSFADMYYFEEDVAIATAKAGLRGVLGQTILKFPTPDAGSYEDALEYTRGFIERWKDHPLIVPAVSPHAPFTCTKEILKACADLAVEFDVPLHTHLAETAVEVENMKKEHEMPVIPYAKKSGLFNAKVLAAHCVHIDTGEIHTLLHHGVGVAHNPSSNMKLASGAAPVQEMLDAGLNVGIGTDGPASNNDLDMFEEIRLTAFLAKLRSGDPTSLPARKAVAMATRLGAKAMHIGDITGSLEPGKRADLILVDINTLHNSPRFRRDPNGIYAQIVYACKSTDVSDVMVNGKWLMQDRELLTIEEAELLVKAQDYAEKMDAFLIDREQSVLSKLIAIGGAAESESFEIQVKVKISNPEPVTAAIESKKLDKIYHRHYKEFDTYFIFDDPKQGQLRHREDEFINHLGEVEQTRTRLTLIGETSEHKFPTDVILSRSRYIAPAPQTLRFLKEYFKPDSEIYIQKDRLRWLVKYKKEDFYINLDHIDDPDLGYYLEVKSRTWSQNDAEKKSKLAVELIELLGANPEKTVTKDYSDMTL